MSFPERDKAPECLPPRRLGKSRFIQTAAPDHRRAVVSCSVTYRQGVSIVL
jgi:hypothetical protein